MPALTGGDSATPKPTQGRKIWGVYVAGDTFHVWTKEEVAALAKSGVQGVMPIVVPPQNESWWLENAGYATTEALVREAKAWGVPKGAPLCLDLEEGQTARMANIVDVFHGWAVATRTHGYRTWTYGGRTALAQDHYGFRWLAEWPDVTPTNPQLPVGFNGWQYATVTAEGIDLDIFQTNRDYMTPGLKVKVLREKSLRGILKRLLPRNRQTAPRAIPAPGSAAPR